MKYHPDRNPGDKTAEEKIKELNAAYDKFKSGSRTTSSGPTNKSSGFAYNEADYEEPGGFTHNESQYSKPGDDSQARAYQSYHWQHYNPTPLPSAEWNIPRPWRRAATYTLDTSLLAGAVLFTEGYERSLTRYFEDIAHNTTLPLLYRALVVFDASILFAAPPMGQEAATIAQRIRELQAMDRAAGASRTLSNHWSLTDLFMAGFIYRLHHGDLNQYHRSYSDPLTWRILYGSVSGGVITPEVWRMFQTSSEGVGYHDRTYYHFFWMVACEDVGLWKAFLHGPFTTFIADVLQSPMYRMLMLWKHSDRDLLKVLALGESNGKKGWRGAWHRWSRSCASYLKAAP